ncbi:MAG TPA: amino acid ABC transporter permease [Candidatus Competibacteraceae bacterium]|nr:amino acid ABC transporter permease [Candidatus Competibacteraceae bacterium]HRZ07754.1 amino acid ABC transporter permease [Candidatus Competibacteraceae bacterium]HSA45798.1 amino acid ABC transporter permease [Candidatus Competibacteraceae bacterium]
MAESRLPHPDLPPPASIIGPWGWMRRNLFSSPLNIALTALAAYLLWVAVPHLLNWTLFNATWSGDTRADCQANSGACWVFIRVHFEQFMYGFYPEAQRWRVNIAVLLLILGAAPLFIRTVPNPVKVKLGLSLLVVYPMVAFVLFKGGLFGLPNVETSRWGGLLLTLVIAGVGMAAALPLGVLLALGRRSKMPAIQTLCVTFIEFWRGVPLITVLFMSSVMLPLFLPEGMNFDKLLRALIGVTLFQAAYMAEVVRGGLQAIPKGQIEAAAALGLGYWKSMALIVLPQALKLVIPGIVNTFIALFKDTSLVLIIGLFDLMNTVHNATTNPDWLGFSTEGYVFAAAVYWLFCFSMSRYSQNLEKRLHTGHKR